MFKYKKYVLIDSPGFGGNERNQDSDHNYKIVADYLRRHFIIQFKVALFLKSINPRDHTDNII